MISDCPSFCIFQTHGLPVERPDERIPVSIFCGRNWSFRLDHRVNTTNLELSVWSPTKQLTQHTSVSDFGRYLEEIVVPNVSMHTVAVVL
jgi:hypothetical protein